MTTTLLDPRIGPLTKQALQFSYPLSTTEGDDPKLRGFPDRNLLNRHEWFEVLYFANKFELTHFRGLINTTPSGLVARKVERMLHSVIPTSLRSHAHIEDWLLRNWSMYPNA